MMTTCMCNSKVNPSMHPCMLDMGMSKIHIQLLLNSTYTVSSPSPFLMLPCQQELPTRVWEGTQP